ncbi:putative alcohol dehydrogenase class III [Klebsiella pneumoniae]|nr:putative alcohol dehydrogenase class III [Klebsiella pneumoniae]
MTMYYIRKEGDGVYVVSTTDINSIRGLTLSGTKTHVKGFWS